MIENTPPVFCITKNPLQLHAYGVPFILRLSGAVPVQEKSDGAGEWADLLQAITSKDSEIPSMGRKVLSFIRIISRCKTLKV